MTWQQARNLDPALIEVGAHTCNHAILSRCSTEQQRQEIGDCKRQIEEKTCRYVEAFCYPNGMPEDYTDETVAVVRNTGFKSAVLAHGGMSSARSDPFRLERLGAPSDLQLFRNSVNGLWHLRNSMRR
jgi:peptidoglycan/xylan/chitin deacetylase (PgdA/CDA1 family)